MTVVETNRWRGVLGVALTSGAVGLFAHRPDVLLIAVVGVAFAVYPRVAGVPEPRLELERRVSDPTPGHGDVVRVTVTLHNRGDRTLPDVRIVDGVPAALTVVEGSPRRGAVLRPGQTATIEYGVAVLSGRHRFEPANVVARDTSGAREVELSLATDTEIACGTGAEDPAVRDRTLATAGLITADRGGSGVEFHRTREYRPGDDPSRIDWKRFARTGEASTVEYRLERAAAVVLLVDAREAAYRAAPDEPHAVSCSVTAAEGLVETLTAARNRVGVAGVGREFYWLPPGAGSEHCARARRLLATHRTFASTPPDPGEDAPLGGQIAELRKRVPEDAQVVLLSPLLDDDVRDAALRLETYGYPVTVISPAVTCCATSGHRLAAAERENRMAALRTAGVTVVDWPLHRPLASALVSTEVGP